MKRAVSKKSAVVGAADHCGWAVLVTVEPDGTVIDRRRVELVDAELPKLPHHHDCQGLPLKEATALLARVRKSADAHAKACLEALAEQVPAKISGIAIRTCPPLPDTVAERLSNYRAQNVADTVMYREALAAAAEARGWFVDWYEVKRVSADAAIDALVERAGAALGSPWQKDHRVAMAAAIAAARRK